MNIVQRMNYFFFSLKIHDAIEKREMNVGECASACENSLCLSLVFSYLSRVLVFLIFHIIVLFPIRRILNCLMDSVRAHHHVKPRSRCVTHFISGKFTSNIIKMCKTHKTIYFC